MKHTWTIWIETAEMGSRTWSRYYYCYMNDVKWWISPDRNCSHLRPLQSHPSSATQHLEPRALLNVSATWPPTALWNQLTHGGTLPPIDIRFPYPNCHFEGNIPDFQTQAFILLGPGSHDIPLCDIHNIHLHYITLHLHYITLTLHYITLHLHLHLHYITLTLTLHYINITLTLH